MSRGAVWCVLKITGSKVRPPGFKSQPYCILFVRPGQVTNYSVFQFHHLRNGETDNISPIGLQVPVELLYVNHLEQHPAGSQCCVHAGLRELGFEFWILSAQWKFSFLIDKVGA